MAGSMIKTRPVFVCFTINEVL